MKYKRFFDAASDMRFISSGCGKLLDVNQAGVELFGYRSKDELLEIDNVGTLFRYPDDETQFNRRLETDGFVKEFEVEMKKNDGTFFPSSITAVIYFEEDGSISCEGVLRDITDLKELQDAYHEAERQNRELSESERRIQGSEPAYTEHADDYVSRYPGPPGFDCRHPEAAHARFFRTNGRKRMEYGFGFDGAGSAPDRHSGGLSWQCSLYGGFASQKKGNR